LSSFFKKFNYLPIRIRGRKANEKRNKASQMNEWETDLRTAPFLSLQSHICPAIKKDCGYLR